MTATRISLSGHFLRSAYMRRVMFVHEPNADNSSSYGSGPASLPPEVFGSSAVKWCGPTEMAWRRTEGPPITVTALDMSYPHDWCIARKFLTIGHPPNIGAHYLCSGLVAYNLSRLKNRFNSNLSDSWWRCFQHAERRVVN